MRSLLVTLTKNIARVGARHNSSAAGLTILDINDKNGIATLTLNRPPVNGLNLDLLTAINDSLSNVEDNRCKGMILTSSSKTVFSAGLDIMEMYKPDQERLKKFWSTLQEVWLKLYGSGFPTAVAINGHAPAGGCLLSLCCEYRVMLPNFTIGLNETQLGIVAPKWFMASMKNVLPSRIAEMALTQGKMFTTDEALNIGLVDDVVNNKEEAIAKCEEFIGRFKKINPVARALTKQAFRSKDLTELEDTKEQDLQTFLFFVNQPKVQKGLEIYMESLKKKGK
ncbi:enoyl-CoA delta isomerase 1, mitochondrial [Condylostylus longicornis]|uniref:enoyl-CoA delta isomerase 1, mitochondrial n=1 Tax=Condylostylus longicornis TaxID=2530218 RepID=UPI00244E208C|nr:enoyl-CoA delta isomerase 1, mitochondrial [Condylostylus longicornis]